MDDLPQQQIPQIQKTIDDLKRRISELENQRIGSMQILPSSINPIHLAPATIKNTGDIFYSDGTRFVSLNIGSAGQILSVLAGIPVWSTPSGMPYVGSFTHNMSVTGTQAITGVGFTPTAVLFFMGMTGSAHVASFGFDDGTHGGAVYDDNARTANNWNIDGGLTASIVYRFDATQSTLGHITAFGSDGFTITWSKTNSPTGTPTIFYLALR